ncbi:MAG TPA: hypothetical protein VGL86_20145 [Polyangia bacterium]|jgi:hypothetical protein
MLDRAIAREAADRAQPGPFWNVTLAAGHDRAPGGMRFAGTSDGRGIVVRHEAQDGGNPRDGWPKSIYAATAGLPSLHCSVELACGCVGMPSDEPTLLQHRLMFDIHGGAPWPQQEALWRVLAARFARLGYRDETLVDRYRWRLREALLALGGAALLGAHGLDEAAARPKSPPTSRHPKSARSSRSSSPKKPPSAPAKSALLDWAPF